MPVLDKRELNKLFYIDLEIKDIKEELEDLEGKAIGAVDYSKESVQTSGNIDKIGNLAIKLSELRSLYELKLEELYIQRTRIERFINSIEDSEIRLIVRYRNVKLMTWEEIANRLGYERTTVSKKYWRFIEGNIPTIPTQKVI